MNWYILFLFGIIIIALLVFLVKSNFKDEKKYEEELNQDFPDSKKSRSDINIEDPMH